MYYLREIHDVLSSVLSFQTEGLPSCRAGLVRKKSLGFGLSGNLLVSPSVWKDSLAGYGILGWQLFSFSALNISTYCTHVQGFWWEIRSGSYWQKYDKSNLPLGFIDINNVPYGVLCNRIFSCSIMIPIKLYHHFETKVSRKGIECFNGRYYNDSRIQNLLQIFKL